MHLVTALQPAPGQVHSLTAARLPPPAAPSPPSPHGSLKATLQRLRRLTETYSQSMIDALSQRAERMGRALGLDAEMYNGAVALVVILWC